MRKIASAGVKLIHFERQFELRVWRLCLVGFTVCCDCTFEMSSCSNREEFVRPVAATGDTEFMLAYR